MAGLLFLVETLAILLIALWLWGQERPAARRRVRLFDARIDEPAAPATAPEPAWRRAEAAPGTAGLRRPGPARHRRPGWRGA